MRGVFDEEELEPVRPRRDKELTLGSATLLAIFFGLVLICGLCFGLGYAMGHHSTESAAVTAPGANAPGPFAAGAAKPSAGAQTPAAPVADIATVSATDAPQAPPPGGVSPAATAQTVPANQYAAQAVGPLPSSISQSLVRPAMNSGNAAAQPQPNGIVRPALAPAGSFTVQIAAVSNQEDADVLSNALRKRGYAVNAKRDPADNLIHVRVGPFGTAAEANSWKNRLLNDGYNAIVQ